MGGEKLVVSREKKCERCRRAFLIDARLIRRGGVKKKFRSAISKKGQERAQSESKAEGTKDQQQDDAKIRRKDKYRRIGLRNPKRRPSSVDKAIRGENGPAYTLERGKKKKKSGFTR